MVRALRRICWGLLLMLVFGPDAVGQAHVVSQNRFLKLHTYLQDTNAVKTWAASTFPDLQGPGAGLSVFADKKSPGGRHITLRQTLNGVIVFDASLKINLDRAQIARSALLNLKDVRTEPVGTFRLSEQDAREIARQASGGQIYKVESCYYLKEGTPLCAYCLETIYDTLSGGTTFVLDATDGRELRRDDRATYYRDTLGVGRVFMPDPLTSAQVYYKTGTPYADNSDVNEPFFEDQYFIVTMRDIRYDSVGRRFLLEGPYVKVEDIQAPFITPPFSLDGLFIYDRSQSGFEAVNAYYHIDRYRRRVDSLGFGVLHDFPIRVDPQGTTDDNSTFRFIAASNDSYIIFGKGGVDDAEDADVLVHEYGHSLSNDASPSSNVGFERTALDEGICDYLAASYSRRLSEFRWADVYTWDGHNEFWSGRTAAYDNKYWQMRNDGRRYAIHIWGQLWSSAIVRLAEGVGYEVADRLTWQELYMNHNNMTLHDAGLLLLEADSLLYAGVHTDTIVNTLCLWELLPGPIHCHSGIANPREIVKQQPDFYLDDEGNIRLKHWPVESLNKLKISIYDVLGRRQSEGVMNKTEPVFTPEPFLAPGVYEIVLFDERISPMCRKIIYFGR